MTRFGRASIDFEQQVRRGEELLCEGRVRLASLDAGSFRPRSTSQLLIDRLNEERP
jgi:acyl-CoA thioester hydrolase